MKLSKTGKRVKPTTKLYIRHLLILQCQIERAKRSGLKPVQVLERILNELKITVVQPAVSK